MKFSIAVSILFLSTDSNHRFKTHAFSILPPLSIQKQPPSQYGVTTRLYGILDEIKSDSYNLFSNSLNDSAVSDIDKAYDAFLGQLVFSTNDPRLDILDNYDLATDPKYLDWLQKKIDKTRDAEEMVALKDLRDMIVDTKKKVEISKLAKEREEKEKEERERQMLEQQALDEANVQGGQKLSNADVLRKASGIRLGGSIGTVSADGAMGGSANKRNTSSFLDSDLTPEIRMSYDELLKKVLPPYRPGETVASVIYNNYDQMDAQFIKVLTERANNGDADSQLVLSALGQEQSKRLAAATDDIRAVLSAGDPMRMEGLIVKMAREGKVNEPFLLLLEANIKQADAAGAMGPAQLMRRLSKRAIEEKDKQSATKEIKLLRKLLRTDDSKEREAILEEAFTPKDKLLVQGTAANAAKALEGEQPDQEKPMPDVPPPDFINACKAVLLNFGNIITDDGRGDLASRIKTIASEAEIVATRIYGKGMTAKEQQDRMWADQTTSIFDLERLEIDAERRGERAPWTNPDNDDILPGFDKEGKMRIGGR